MQYASVTEAPPKMHIWSGIGALSGALRKKVWIDMKRFIWTPSFYVIYVAPPGIVAKTTTADLGMDLLREVPGIKFGPDAVTWQSLVTSFAAAGEAFLWGEEQVPMSPITLVASELGNLLNLQDREMVTLLITLWDGRPRYEKQTKMSGNDIVDAPWINIQACTTPNWIAENMPPSMVGGGLSSRCIFIYADQKFKYVPLVDEAIKEGDRELRLQLIHDLEYISLNLVGPFQITEEARAWERERYVDFWSKAAKLMDTQMIDGYAARKQTHLFKLAMVLSVSRGDSLTLEIEDLLIADQMLRELEADMHKVFSRIGQSEEARQAERLVEIIGRAGKMSYEEAYRSVHTYFPDAREFEALIMGLVKSGQLMVINTAEGPRFAPRVTAA